MKWEGVIFLLFVILLSCGEEGGQPVRFERPDSVQAHRLAAAFMEGDAISMVVLHKVGGRGAMLFATRENFPPFADSLVSLAAQKFRSPKFSRTYEVGADSVTVHYSQKIIHPCYNWQGQSPWQEYGTAAYARLDK